MSTFADNVNVAIREVRKYGARDAQNIREAIEFIEFFADKEIKGYIEVGTRHGWTFYLVAKCLHPEWMIAIDKPGEPPWGDAGSEKVLANVIDKVRDMGITATLIYGDSADWSTLAQVEYARKERHADLIFIDGDHKKKAVWSDWNNYWPICKGYLAFHDTHTRKGGVEVIDVWQELKHELSVPSVPTAEYRFHEINYGIGIGIVAR